MTIIVISIIGGFFAIAAVVCWAGVDPKDMYDDSAFHAMICMAVVILVVLVPIIGQHTHVLAIPLRIAAIERTIEQQKELIAVDATLGQGLEGLEIKQEIQLNIRKLNDLIARAEYIAISPWWMFKPNMSGS